MKQFRRRWGALALLTLAALLLSATAFAASVPDPTADFYVNDYAGVLSSATKDDIVTKNDGLYAATGAQIVVSVVQNTGGTTLEQYAYDMANTWGIGDADKDNGVILLLSIDDDDYICAQGSGLETLLPTTTLSRILQEKLEPDFAAQNYDAGVRKTFAALYDELCDIYNYNGSAVGINPGANTGNAPAPDRAPGTVSYAGRVLNMVVTLTVILVIVIILTSVLTATRRRRRTYTAYPPVYTRRTSFWSRRPRRTLPPPPPPPPPGGWGGRPAGPGPGAPRPPSPPPRNSRPPSPPRSGGFGGFGGSSHRAGGGGSFGGSSRSGGSSRGGFSGGASRGGGSSHSGGSRSGGGGSFRGGGAGRGR